MTAPAKWACRLCIITKGLKGSELADLPDADEEAAQIRHLFQAHGIRVRGYDEEGNKLPDGDDE